MVGCVGDVAAWKHFWQQDNINRSCHLMQLHLKSMEIGFPASRNQISLYCYYGQRGVLIHMDCFYPIR